MTLTFLGMVGACSSEKLHLSGIENTFGLFDMIFLTFSLTIDFCYARTPANARLEATFLAIIVASYEVIRAISSRATLVDVVIA